MANNNTIYSNLDVGNKKNQVESNAGLTRRLSHRIGKVVGVNTKNNTMSLQWLWPFRGSASNVEIGSSYIGFRSGIRFTPEIGSILVVGYAGERTVSMSYLLPSQYESLLNQEKDSKGKRTRIRELDPGEIDIYSSEGAEIYLHESVEIKDRGQNSIVMDRKTGEIILTSVSFSSVNEAGTLKMGPVERFVDTGVKVITDDGLPFNSLNGGNALNEVNLKVVEFSDKSISTAATDNNVIADITVGTLVDVNGKKVVNQNNNEIVCEIRFDSGAKIQVDKTGAININEGRATKVTDTPSINANPLNSSQTITSTDDSGIVTPYAYTPAQCEQRAAREGDRITIPLSPMVPPDLDHPGLALKSAVNLATMQQLAASFVSPMGPCTFVPVPNLTLVGEITQGANGVHIGSLNKVEEATENSENS